MSHETRIVRPFVLPRKVGRVFDGVRMRFGTATCEPGGRIYFQDPDEYLRAKPTLSWAEDDAGFTAFREEIAHAPVRCRIDPDAVALVVTAHTSYLRITDLLIEHPIREIDGLRREAVFHQGDRPRALRASTHGATIKVYLVLRRNIDRQTLRPWRKGTWLAAATFRIGAGTVHQLFRPIPLNKELRKQLGLPPHCLQYLDLGDQDPLRRYAASSAPDFYVDADVLAQVDRCAHTAAGRALQLQLARDFVAGVIMDVAARHTDALEERSWRELRDSIFGRIVAMAVGKGGSISEREEMIKCVREDDPGRLLSGVEHALKLSVRIGEALTPDE